MASSNPRPRTSYPGSHLTVSLSCGSTPCESETGREFLQERIAFYAKIIVLLGAGFYVFANAIHWMGHPGEPAHFIECGHNVYHLISIAVLGLMWFLASRGKPSHGMLRAIDLGGSFLACSCYALISLTGCEGRLEYQAILATTNTLIARAILVPSQPLHTLWLGIASSVPTLLAAHAIVSRPGGSLEVTYAPGVVTAFLGLWCTVAVVVSTVTSRVTYGLRREVREAKRLGQYTLEEKIGAGGMGEVYKAKHALLRRPTAVKLLRSDMAGDRCIARFEREVQLTSRLTHPNTIAIYDFGRTPEGTFYYAMEYLPGITLEDLVREDGHQGAGRTIHIVRQVCASLAEAHGIGLIHRDIKGANIMLCERGGAYDVAKVLDFGLVKDTENPTNVTLSAANIITGTPLYLSPEAIRSPEKVDARSDIYSVGVLAYYLITGKQLFEGRNFVEVCGHHLHTPPVPPSARVSWSIPGDLERVILSCIEKDPDRRPASAKELHDALEACADSQAWKERHAERWWRENEARIKQACSRSAPTEALGRDAGGVAVTAVIEPVRTEG